LFSWITVHQLLGMHDLAAEGRAYALVAEADAEQRDPAGEFLDRCHRDAGFGRRTGAGRNHDAVRLHRGDFLEGDRVVAEHLDVLAEFAEILHQVVGEAVVVVDHQ
jgi:hypothetical protein